MGQPLRVLSIEDVEDDYLLLMRELRRGGFNVTSERVETPEEVVAAWHREKWDVVLSDYSLPQLDGLTALRLLRQLDPDAAVIIISGTIGEETAVTALHAGARDFMLKTNLTRLVPAIERALDSARVQRQRRAAEHALREREVRFRALVENASDSIVVLDKAGLVTYASPALGHILGIAPDAAVGRSMHDLMNTTGGTELTQLMNELQAAPHRAHRVEFHTRHRDGAQRVLRGQARNLLSVPAVAGFVLNVHDATEEQLAQLALRETEERLRQAQKLDGIGRLAGGVAHDFNNLLSVIRSSAEFLIADIEAGTPQIEDAEEIRKAADRAARLTSQLLAFSRRQVLEPRVLNMNALIESMHGMLQRLIPENVRIVTELQPSVPPVRADQGQMEQVLVNLIVNARDAMPEGGTVRVTTEVLYDSASNDAAGFPTGPVIVISISDTGLGMTPDVVERIFEPFFTTKGGRGTGLGLSTVYGIVQQTGGQIRVQSAPGRGTVFRVLLPACNDEPDQLEGQAAPRVAQGGNEVVLLVEDEPAVRKVAERILGSAGYTVLTAPDARAALQIAAQHHGRIDLLLTDLVMPGMGGRALSETLRASDERIAMLYMSGYSEEENSSNLPLDGELLQKPFTPERLLDFVRNTLKNRAERS